MTPSPITDKLHTAYEWNELLDYGIISYDGFRDGTITTETKMSRNEFERRSQQATRKLKPPITDEARKCAEDIRKYFYRPFMLDQEAFSNPVARHIQALLDSTTTELRAKLKHLEVDPTTCRKEFLPLLQHAKQKPVYWMELAELAESNCSKLRAQVDTLTKERDEARRSQSALWNTVRDLQSSIHELRAIGHSCDYRQVVDSFRDKVARHIKQHDNIQLHFASANDRATTDALRAQLAAEEGNRRNLMAANDRLEGHIATITAERDEARRLFEQSEAEIMTCPIDDVTASLVSALAENAALRAALKYCLSQATEQIPGIEEAAYFAWIADRCRTVPATKGAA